MKPVAIWNCTLKKRYLTKKAATEAAEDIFTKWNAFVDVYHCNICEGWHLTKSKG